jgi:hypothetical protein
VTIRLPMERAGFKFEARNPKFETNPNILNGLFRLIHVEISRPKIPSPLRGRGPG